MEVSVGGRSNNCKASLTAEADPLCKGTAVMVVCGGGSAIPTGVVCTSFIDVGCVFFSSSGWGVPSLSAAPRSCPEVSPSYLVALGVGATADHRVDLGRAGRASSTPGA